MTRINSQLQFNKQRFRVGHYRISAPQQTLAIGDHKPNLLPQTFRVPFG